MKFPLPSPSILSRTLLPLAVCLCSLTAIAGTADLVLYDFSSHADFKNVVTNKATATPTKSGYDSVIRVVTEPAQPWPGIALKAPNQAWDLSDKAQVIVRLRNPGSSAVTVYCRVDNPGANGTERCVSAAATIEPAQVETLRIALRRAADDQLDGKLFGMRGYPVSATGPGIVNASNISQVLLFVNQAQQRLTFEVQDLRATGAHVDPTAWTKDADPFFPFIDTFGQYRHKSWPGKVKSMADLAEKTKAEASELAQQPGPKDWSNYGGWSTGPTLKASGFFRTEKVRGKWWLVDPEGRLFFSHGLDCVRMLDTTPIEERDAWFEDFPGPQPSMAEFLSTGYALKGHYEGRTIKCFSFSGANLLRKYGAEWKTAYRDVVHRRLRSWGINTIANWSDEGTFLLRRTPYTDNIGSRNVKPIEGSEGYWARFPDVFDPAFSDSLRKSMERKKGKSAGDPWCIGYFSDNEMSWGDELSLALASLKSGPEQPAKRAAVDDLRAKYGSIEKLNAQWGTSHTSWEALLQHRNVPDKEKAKPDLEAFYTRIAERYFRVVRDAIKEAAPNQLYLGCRFAWGNARAARAAAKFCDVVSYNLYNRSVANFKFNGDADVPLIIGEFHFGALDRGMFHTGLVPVPSQEARAQAYREYVMGALRHPQFVGCHWFQYQDEPTTGRVLDEENYQIGFVDIADTPYPEMVAVSRRVAESMYVSR